MPPINPKDKIKSMKKKSSFNKKGPQSIGIYFILFIIVLGLYGFLFIPQETQKIEEPRYEQLLSDLESGKIVSLYVQPVDGEDNQNMRSVQGEMMVDGKKTIYTANVPNSELSRIYDLALSNNIEINNKLASSVGKIWSFLSYA